MEDSLVNNSFNMSLSYHYDPSSSISVLGHARVNSPDSIAVLNGNTASGYSLVILIVLVIVVVTLAALGAIVSINRRRPPTVQ